MPEFQNRNQANRDSYSWDHLIELVAKDVLDNTLEIGPGLEQSEMGLRVMAREDRFCRRLLGRNFIGFLHDARSQKIKARLMQSPSGPSYVLFKMPPEDDRQMHLPELQLRCFVARGHSTSSSEVVGIGVSDAEKEGFSLTIIYYNHPDWTEEDSQMAESIQEELDFFRSSRLRRLPEDEYPTHAR